MRKCFIVLPVLIFLGLVIQWSGCATRVEKTVEVAIPAPDTGSSESGGYTAPDWFLNIPEDSNHIYAATTASSKLLNLAFDSARNTAQVDLANQMEVKISGIFKRFIEESGAGEDADLRAITTTASKSAVEELLKGAKPIKQAHYKEGTLYHAFVLMKMPLGTVNATLVEKIKDNKDLYTQFRASQSFKDLEAEIEKAKS